MTSPQQLPLPLPVLTASGREDFFVSPANALAVAMIEGWRNWGGRKLVLNGPEGSGKTHLAHVWAAQSGAVIVPARELADTDIPRLANSCVCVEDIPGIAGDPRAEEALFHLHNLVLAQGHALLLTGVGAPSQWAIGLPDLYSRIQACATAPLPEPDDVLLSALLTKLFADRQVMPAPDVLRYLVEHMPRSYADAHTIVAQLDAAAMAKRGGLTRKLAGEVLRSLAHPRSERQT